MNPLENLSRDHSHIAAALDAIDSSITAAARGWFDLRWYQQVLAFIETWSDGAHYQKEELLFGALEGAGLPRAMGPTSFLEMEHAGTRDQARRIGEAIAGIQAGRFEDRALLLDAVGRYSAIVRMHMPKEDLGYFKMSAAMLGAPMLEHLGGQFEAIDAALPESFADASRSLQLALVAHETPPDKPTNPPVLDVQELLIREAVRSLNVEATVAPHVLITRRR